MWKPDISLIPWIINVKLFIEATMKKVAHAFNKLNIHTLLLYQEGNVLKYFYEFFKTLKFLDWKIA